MLQTCVVWRCVCCSAAYHPPCAWVRAWTNALPRSRLLHLPAAAALCGPPQVYASLHSIMITLLMHSRSWPFRPDVPYFRLFTVIQFVGMLGAGCIILLGIYATQNQSRCDKGNKSCDQVGGAGTHTMTQQRGFLFVWVAKGLRRSMVGMLENCCPSLY